MKKALILLTMMILFLSGCTSENTTQRVTFTDGQEALDYLISSNDKYVKATKNDADISSSIRQDNAENGQTPYAVVITCSDSRVAPEHIFNAGIGELFVIRTAGNVISEFELGSIEYGAEHLNAPLILVLGHTNCGAVSATISGGAHGNIQSITDEIATAISGETDATQAEILNVMHSKSKIESSEIITELVENDSVLIKGATYDISTGLITIID